MIDRLMGALMACFGGLLLGGVLFRWQWFVSGAKYRRLSSVSPWLAAGLYGTVGLFLLVAGILHLIGLWPEAAFAGGR